MAEIRETLRFGSADLEEMNRVMGRLQDRLDELEGRRGTPSFYSSLDLQGNRATNASPSEASTDVVIKSELDEVNNPQVAPGISSFKPYQASIVAGTSMGNPVENMQNLADGSVYEVDEVAATPGFNIHISFKNIDNFHAVALRCDYTGTSGHIVGIDLYNYDKEDYDQLSLLSESSTYYRYYTIYGLNSDNYISNGNVLLRLYHYSGGNAAHKIYIDYAALLKYTV